MSKPLVTKDFLSLERIALDAPVASRREAFEMIGRLVPVRAGVHPSDIAQRLAGRERHGTTAIGHGLAIPHAQIKGLGRPVAVFIRVRSPIAFEAPDGKPVSDLLALLVPKPAVPQHFALLADFTRLLSDRDFRQALAGCTSTFGVWQLFEQWPFHDGRAARLQPPGEGAAAARMQQCNAIH